MAVGYVKAGRDRIEKDADLRVREATLAHLCSPSEFPQDPFLKRNVGPFGANRSVHFNIYRQGLAFGRPFFLFSSE